MESDDKFAYSNTQKVKSALTNDVNIDEVLFVS